VILASDLADIYGVETRSLNQAIKRNAERFPPDFIFQLTREEVNESQRSEMQTPASNTIGNLKSQTVISSWGGARRALPYAFTEHGAIMAAMVLNSPQAVKMSVFVVRDILVKPPAAPIPASGNKTSIHGERTMIPSSAYKSFFISFPKLAKRFGNARPA